MSQVTKRARRETVDPLTSSETPAKGDGVATAAGRRPPRKAYVPDEDDEPIDFTANANKGDGGDVKPKQLKNLVAGRRCEKNKVGGTEEDSEGETAKEDFTDEAERKLLAEGDALTGDALKDFLKKNFTDFVDDKLLDIDDIDDI